MGVPLTKQQMKRLRKKGLLPPVGSFAFGTPDKRKSGEEYLYVLEEKYRDKPPAWKSFIHTVRVDSGSFDPDRFYALHLSRREIEDAARDLSRNLDDGLELSGSQGFGKSWKVEYSNFNLRYQPKSLRSPDKISDPATIGTQFSLAPSDVRKLSGFATVVDYDAKKRYFGGDKPRRKKFQLKGDEDIIDEKKGQDSWEAMLELSNLEGGAVRGKTQDIYIASELAKGNYGKKSAVSQPVNKIINRPMKVWDAERYKVDTKKYLNVRREFFKDELKDFGEGKGSAKSYLNKLMDEIKARQKSEEYNEERREERAEDLERVPPIFYLPTSFLAEDSYNKIVKKQKKEALKRTMRRKARGKKELIF